MDLLSVRTVSKRFQNRNVVDGLSFSVRQGEVFALLGPNGAGKTTTLRMLLGILRPDQGTIELRRAGGQPFTPARIGYLPEDRGLYRDIPVQRTLVYMGILRGLPRDEATRLAQEWLARVGLQDRAHDKLETLSRGNQQKVQFVSSLLHGPEFAVLDEPFSGLDPINQEFFIDILRELRQRGMTVLLSAHHMELVERLADRVLLMDQGREVLGGTLPEVRRRAKAADRVTVRVSEGADLSRLMNSPMVHRAVPGAAGEFVFFIKQGVSLHTFLHELSVTAELLDIHTQSVSLHDIFVEALRHGNRTDATGATE
jgi:ABC-2 type transport system ATP-binding protein